jgi:hypothetical protein
MLTCRSRCLVAAPWSPRRRVERKRARLSLETKCCEAWRVTTRPSSRGERLSRLLSQKRGQSKTSFGRNCFTGDTSNARRAAVTRSRREATPYYAVKPPAPPCFCSRGDASAALAPRLGRSPHQPVATPGQPRSPRCRLLDRACSTRGHAERAGLSCTRGQCGSAQFEFSFLLLPSLLVVMKARARARPCRHHRSPGDHLG